MTQLQSYSVDINENLTVEFCANSMTIRQWPQNYMLVHRDAGDPSRLMLDADTAADPQLVGFVAMALLEFKYRYPSGQEDFNGLVKDVANRYWKAVEQDNERETQYLCARLVELNSISFENIALTLDAAGMKAKQFVKGDGRELLIDLADLAITNDNLFQDIVAEISKSSQIAGIDNVLLNERHVLIYY